MQTVANEIELVLNSRPFGVFHDDDLEVLLSTNHLLYGRQLHFNNYNDSVEDGVFDVHKHIEYLETVLNHLWNRWSAEYIPSLLEYQKLCKRQNQIIPSVGDIANICDDKVFWHKWLLRCIYDVITDRDGPILFCFVQFCKVVCRKNEKRKKKNQLNTQWTNFIQCNIFMNLLYLQQMKIFDIELEEKLQF